MVFQNSPQGRSTTEILNPLQRVLLQQFAVQPLFHDFYLTGGTALSAFYLEHRYSEDLDFFTEVPQGVARIIPVIEQIAKGMNLKMVFGRRFETLFECTLMSSGNETVELDLALDMPGRLMPVQSGKALGMNLDNILDIACNKLSALYERSEPKDFVDLFFITQGLFPLEELLRKARQKYPHLDDYGLAMTFFKVKGVEKLPRMLKPLQLEELKQYFLEKADQLSSLLEEE
jgi:hypothetical protein